MIYINPSVVYACLRGGQLHLFIRINLIPILEFCILCDPFVLLGSVCASPDKPEQCPQDKTRSETSASVQITLTTSTSFRTFQKTISECDGRKAVQMSVVLFEHVSFRDGGEIKHTLFT